MTVKVSQNLNCIARCRVQYGKCFPSFIFPNLFHQSLGDDLIPSAFFRYKKKVFSVFFAISLVTRSFREKHENMTNEENVYQYCTSQRTITNISLLLVETRYGKSFLPKLLHWACLIQCNIPLTYYNTFCIEFRFCETLHKLVEML